MMLQKAIILLSGGLDSTTCLAIAKSQGYDCYALSFSYGQKSISELNAARRVVKHFGITHHHITDLSIGKFGGSALTDKNISVPKYTGTTEIPITYVPARNTIFLSIGLGFAEVVDAQNIFIGANAVDYSGYPDCRPEYFEAFQAMANLATKASANNKTIQIQTPILTLSKTDIIKTGIALGVDYSLTVSCYQATSDGLACGQCDSCVLRKNGFAKAGIVDPTQYV